MISLKTFLSGLALLCALAPSQAQDKFRVMEYNVENLFDCSHDSLKNDYEFQPDSPRGWTKSRYYDKLAKIAKVILAAGDKQVPDLVGLCEVENEHCVQDLVKNSPLRDAGYDFAITQSPDERGIDVVLLYQPATFRHLSTHAIGIPSKEIDRRPTRDILHVSGRIVTGDTLDVFVCHMPSRSGGEKQSEPYRLFTAGYLRRAADSVMAVRQHPNVIVMGDFNDYPSNRSIAEVIGAVRPGDQIEKTRLYNLMDGKEGGTYRYRGEWGTLDQMMVSGYLLEGNERIRAKYEDAQILKFPFLLEEDDRYGGESPSRTYWGKKYHGGYSDHLPVLLELELKEE